ncbi:MAG: sugar-binding domain-containing protein [Armatimonadota bacterium]
MRITLAAAALAVLLVIPAGAQMTGIDEYLPEDAPTDGSIDLTARVQRALNERSALYFPGGDDPESPRVYALRAPLEVRDGSVLVFGPNSLVRRLPSEGALLRLGHRCRITGCVIDGNKYAHWPQFQDLGKSDYGILCRSQCVIEECFVYNNPGIAFGTWADYSTFIRCRAENVGYIDVKFGADFYQGAWDKWSGDGFYIRGRANTVRDCEAYDCFRWDLCASHSGARGNTFVDCRCGDVNWRSYGMVDIEGAEANNRLIRCYSPNSRVAVSTAHTEVIDCIAAGFSCYRADYITIRGCTALREGITLGRPAQEDKAYGGRSPNIVGNRIFMPQAEGRHAPQALHVRSEDGLGVVEGNIIYAWEDGGQRGEPILVEGCEAGENQVIYGQWDIADRFVRPRLTRGWVDWEHIGQHKLHSFEQELAEALPALGIEGEPAWKHVIIGEVPFSFASGTNGIEAGWFNPGQRPEETRDVRVGWPWNKQVGDTYRPGWYFIDFEVPAEQAGRPAVLYLGGVDSEAMVWLNGQKLGEHQGWDEPFSFQLPEGLQEGANHLVIRSYTEAGLAGVYKPIAVLVK